MSKKVEAALYPKGADKPGDYSPIARLAVAATGPLLERRLVPHAALLYRKRKGGEVRVFEMEGHEKLRDAPVPAEARYVWVVPRLPPERLGLIVQRALLIQERNQASGLPYGFRFARTCFDANGIMKLGDGEIGVTCATIITAILESEKVTILDPAAWPPADKTDIATRRAYVRSLKETNPDRAAALEKEIEAPRIAPSEVVAAAAVHPPEVATFESIQDGALVVLNRIGEGPVR